MSLSSLGFKTISSLVESLKADLVVKGGMVFHKIYLPGIGPVGGTSTEIKASTRPTTPQTPESLRESSSSNPATQVPASQRDNSPYIVSVPQSAMNFIGSPLSASTSSSSTHYVPENPPVAASQPATQLTQDQLYVKVMQVRFCMKLLFYSFHSDIIINNLT